MLLLFDTSSGFAIFKVLDEGKLKDVDNLHKHFANAEAARSVVKLKAFHAFEDTKDAVAAATALVEGHLDGSLKKLLKKAIVKKELTAELLGVSDPKIGAGIKKKFNIQCVNDEAVKELTRGIRSQFANLADGIDQKTVDTKARALSHSLSRYKLKFSPEKVDTMVVQAIGLLDDLDKEINTYAMRVKEWYGWHFPELQKIVLDNLQYAQVCLKLGMRKGVDALDFSDILSEEGQTDDVKQAAKISMGTEITNEDLRNIHSLCHQVTERA
jgi:nucleolar protein 58